MGNLNDKFEALLRGGAQGATAGWGDEGVASLLGKLPMPEDPEGIPREYAAGSAEQDYRNTERGANAESERRFPGTYHSGKALGAAPALGIGGASGIAGAGLVGGARGAVAGAGNAEEGNRLQGAARLAGPEALGSMAGAAAPAVLGKMKDLFGNLPPPSGGLVPAYAGAGSAAGGAASETGMPFINTMSTIPAKGARGAGRGRVPAGDERIIAQDRETWEKANPEEAARTPNVGKPAMRPPAPSDPEVGYTPTIPPAGQTGVPSLSRGFQDLVDQDAELAKEAARQPARIKMRERLIDKTPPVNYADPMQNPLARENDPTWRAMNEQIYGRKFEPMGRNNPGWHGADPARAPRMKGTEDFTVPKQDKLPDLEKENGIAEAHARLKEGEDAIKKRPKQANAGDNIRALLGKL